MPVTEQRSRRMLKSRHPIHGVLGTAMDWHRLFDLINQEAASGIVGSSVSPLLLAAILGGVIGLERELNHRPAGLRTNMFICFGAALFTVLSAALAGVPSDAA